MKDVVGPKEITAFFTRKVSKREELIRRAADAVVDALDGHLSDDPDEEVLVIIRVAKKGEWRWEFSTASSDEHPSPK